MMSRSIFPGLRSLLGPATISGLHYRFINTEWATALRPFYFAVHPDLFGQHPEQRKVNEESLKLLSAHMQMLHEQKYNILREKRELKFYIRDENSEDRGKFKLISFSLDNHSRDPKLIIKSLLELCNLSTDYVNAIKDVPKEPNMSAPKGGGYSYNQDYHHSEFADFGFSFYQAKQETQKSLDTWIDENAQLARERSRVLEPLKRDVLKLQKQIKENLGVKETRYDCGWNFEHYRGCLMTLERMASMHKDQMEHLKGRIVVFAPFTGISLEGHVMLYTGDVLTNWLKFIRNIPEHDAFLQKIPLYERTLAQVLRQIRIGRRKFMPKQQAKEYASHLLKVTTSLGDYLSSNKYPESWPDSLSEYEIVIESEAGPLMVSPTGQLIAPATCPGLILVDFLTSNFPVAKEKMEKYVHEKYIERELKQLCLEQMQLKMLTKDDSVTPEKMIVTLTDLLKLQNDKFKEMELHVTNYYSVLSDGVVCIPWDFKNRR